MTAGPLHDIASFAEALRGRGMTVTPDQMSDMAQSLMLIDPTSRDHVYVAFRALAITDPGHRVPYDEEFRRFFEGSRGPRATTEQHSSLATSSVVKPVIQSIPGEALDSATSQAGASSVENVADRDFSDLDDDQLEQARHLVKTMMWDPNVLRTRRWAPNPRGSRPDLRRSLRGATGPEGDLLAIEMKQRRLRQRPLIVIADISGSMEKYAELFLVFAHAAQHRLDTVEVFTFSTHLTRITEDLSRRDTKNALMRVNRSVTDWSGGTRIGDALAEWNRAWSRRLARGGPVALILSDGWDCGEPSLLAEEMARLSRSVHQVLWLNPLAARADYAPATRGMRAVMPYVDNLLPAASVNDLRDVVRLLESLGAVRP